MHKGWVHKGGASRVNNYRYDKSYSAGAREEFAASFIRELKEHTDGDGYDNTT